MKGKAYHRHRGGMIVVPHIASMEKRMLDRQQDFWNRVRILLQSIQAGAPVNEARHKLSELIGEFGVGEQDVATALLMMGELSGAERGEHEAGYRAAGGDANG